jgi:hypothetical protein
MLSRRLLRVAEMDLFEIGWRGRLLARNAMQRAAARRGPSSWDRRALMPALSRAPALADIRAALASNAWDDAHRRLAKYLAARPPRFLIGGPLRSPVVSTILERFPGSAAEAAARARRIANGEYDLLGYRGLRFDDSSDGVDWHWDPVHDRRAGREFWTDVRYLDPACGDHKIIWELNRHQHWTALGRAYWLTGERQYRDRCIAECVSWLAANPPLRGINWSSMLELGIRSISWIWALNFFAGADLRDEDPWIVDLLLALDRQLTQIEHNLSYYFSPNTHLLGEALALYVSGRALPELAASSRRQAIGRRILVDEIARQVLPDGGHCERSTHYHRYALDFYNLALAVARATEDPIAPTFEDAVARLGWAMRLLADDRGRIPLIGDDDGGSLLPMAGRPADDVRDSLAIAGALAGRSDFCIGDAPEEAHWMLSHPKLNALPRSPATAGAPPAVHVRSGALRDTGYYVSRSAEGDHLIVDGGAHGYQNAGHAHADALSLTLTVGGTPFLIDTGTGCYTIDPGVRDRLRSTALHNTLVVDDRPQSIPEGPFHWSSRADGWARRWIAKDGFDYFEGSHDGYAPLEHRRHVFVLHADLVVVADRIHGSAGSHRASVHWHVDRRWNVALDGGLVTFEHGAARCQLAVVNGSIERFEADPVTGLGWHAPSYGRIEPSTTIRATHESSTPFWIISAFGLRPANPIVAGSLLPVISAAGDPAGAVAVEIVRKASRDLLVIADPIDAASWRVGELEASARVLFHRSSAAGSFVTRVVVDGPDTVRA